MATSEFFSKLSLSAGCLTKTLYQSNALFLKKLKLTYQVKIYQVKINLEAATRRCSIKKMFLNISKYLSKHLCRSFYFNKVAGPKVPTQRPNTDVFL